VSDVSSQITTATISDIKIINKTIKFVKSHKSLITVPKLDLNSLAIKVLTDASFNNLDGRHSQGGYIALLWSSNRVRSVVRSTLAAESQAFADGAESSLYLARMILEFLPNLAKIIWYTDSRSLFESAGSSKAISDKCHQRDDTKG